MIVLKQVLGKIRWDSWTEAMLKNCIEAKILKQMKYFPMDGYDKVE